MATSSTSVSGTTVSHSPWFITYDDGAGALIWKNNLRLKLSDGVSAGSAKSVAVENKGQGIIAFKGCDANGSREFLFRGLLENYDSSSSSSLNESLHDYISRKDAIGFCQILNEVTNVTFELQQPVTEKKKRKRKNTEVRDDEFPAKKVHVLTASDHLVGQFEINISSLIGPQPHYKIREIKEWYVNYLAKTMKQDSDHLTAPFVVLANVEKSIFDEKKLNDYKYEVIGGVHRYSAIKKINSSGIKIKKQKCVVYGKNLSKENILLLAQQHNNLNQIQRVTTFSEAASICRNLLFKHFAEDAKVDDGEYFPDIPRYNSKPYRDWKADCMLYTVTPRMGESTVLQAIQMSLQPPKVYHLMQKVFLMYEEGTLKGKKWRDLENPDILQKSLEGALSAKLTHFKIFQGLQDDQKIEILMKLSGKEITMEAASNISKEMKEMNVTKEKFLKKLSFKTWQEAEEKAPRHAEETKLKLFAGKRCSSKDFEEYCEEAKGYKPNEECEDQVEHIVYQAQRIQIHLAPNITRIANVIRNQYTLLSISALKEWSVDDLHHAIICMMDRNKEKSFCLLVTGLKSYDSLLESLRLNNLVNYKIITLMTPCEANAISGKGNVRLVLLAFFGTDSDIPDFIEKDTADAFLCQKTGEMIDSKFVHDPIDWLQFLFKRIVKRKSSIFDVYGSAELIEEGARRKCDVVSLQRNKACIDYIMHYLNSLDSTCKDSENEEGEDDSVNSSDEVEVNNSDTDNSAKGIRKTKKSLQKIYPLRRRK